MRAWIRASMGALLALVVASVVLERARRADRDALRQLQPKCIRDRGRST